jgi:outer membrane protein assembly factor BamB
MNWNRVSAATLFFVGIECGGCSDGGLTPGGEPRVHAGVVETFRTVAQKDFPFIRPALDAERIYADYEGGGPIVALSRTTGEEVWRYERPFGGPSSVSVHRGKVLFAGTYAIALDAVTGRELWRYDLGGSASLGVTSAQADGFYLGTDRFILGVSVQDGSLLWRTEVGPGWRYRGIVRGVSVSGDTVYANVEQYLAENGHLAVGHVFALDRRTGAILWKFTEGDGTDRSWFRNEPVVAGRFLLLSDHEKNMWIAVDRMTGQLRWRAPGDRDRYFGALDAPKVSGDTVYAASADRWVTAMNLNTGAVLWATRLGGSIDAITLCGNRVLAHDLGLNVLERTTGKLLKVVVEDTPGYSTLLVSKFASDGRHAYVLGNRFVYGYRCPE